MNLALAKRFETLILPDPFPLFILNPVTMDTSAFALP
jgi:hypothetical protein